MCVCVRHHSNFSRELIKFVLSYHIIWKNVAKQGNYCIKTYLVEPLKPQSSLSDIHVCMCVCVSDMDDCDRWCVSDKG